jgi:hypothetical protein
MRCSLRAPLPLLALALAACVDITPHRTTIASEPPGARVLIDGRDSGWVTPCHIALDEEEEHVVRVSLAGHESREVVIVPFYRLKIVHWTAGVNGVRSTVRFPILLPTIDFLFPFSETDAAAPGRVFVRLRPESTS